MKRAATEGDNRKAGCRCLYRVGNFWTTDWNAAIGYAEAIADSSGKPIKIHRATVRKMKRVAKIWKPSVIESTAATATCQSGIQAGRRYVFIHPVYPFHGIRAHATRYAPHFIEVTRVVDLASEPLTCEQVEAEPLMRRGRWRIIGTDMATGTQVSFYDEFIEQIHEVTDSTARPPQTGGIA